MCFWAFTLFIQNIRTVIKSVCFYVMCALVESRGRAGWKNIKYNYVFFSLSDDCDLKKHYKFDVLV